VRQQAPSLQPCIQALQVAKKNHSCLSTAHPLSEPLNCPLITNNQVSSQNNRQLLHVNWIRSYLKTKHGLKFPIPFAWCNTPPDVVIEFRVYWKVGE